MCELTPATTTFSTLEPNKTPVEMIGRFTECHPSLYLFQKASWLTAGVWGGLACGQIYDFNQQPSPLMKCLAGAVLQNGVRGHVLWRRRCALNARGMCASPCWSWLLGRRREEGGCCLLEAETLTAGGGPRQNVCTKQEKSLFDNAEGLFCVCEFFIGAEWMASAEFHCSFFLNRNTKS